MRGCFIFFYLTFFICCIKNVKSDGIMTPINIVSTNPVEDCIEESKVSRALVEKLKIGLWKTSNKNLKTWVLCYLAKNDVMSLDGVLRQDEVLKDIPDRDKTKIEKLINKCLYKKRHDPVETAWHYLTCFQANEPKYLKLANKLYFM